MKSNLLKFETNLLNQGIKYIAGIDEVGRGPLAGPLVVGATILDIEKIVDLTNNDVTDLETNLWDQVNDSKKLTHKKRTTLNEFLMNEVICYAIVEIPNTEIDDQGMTYCIQKAFFSAINKLPTKPQHILTDFVNIKEIPQHMQTNIIGGDGASISIAAASILAKVYRDALMDNYHDQFPLYGFDKHKGYGTKVHIDAIKSHGYCDIHRKSFVLKGLTA